MLNTLCKKCDRCMFNPALKDKQAMDEVKRLKQFPPSNVYISDEDLFKRIRRDSFVKWDCKAYDNPNFYETAAPHDIAAHIYNVRAKEAFEVTHGSLALKNFDKLTVEKGLGKALKNLSEESSVKLSDFIKSGKGTRGDIEALAQADCAMKNDDKTYSITNLGRKLLEEFHLI